MNRDDIIRMAQEAEVLRQRYEELLKILANNESLNKPPMMLGHKESYELGRLHGAAAEREECAKVCDDMHLYTGYDCADAIRARGQG